MKTTWEVSDDPEELGKFSPKILIVGFTIDRTSTDGEDQPGLAVTLCTASVWKGAVVIYLTTPAMAGSSRESNTY